jgi:paraquat-inducible protein A
VAQLALHGPDPGCAGARVFACFDCGQFHRLPDMPPKSEARCRRCHAVLQRRKPDPLHRALAWAIAAFAAFVIAATLPFLHIDLYGRTNDIVLGSGPAQLDRDGLWEIGLLVGAFTIAAPAARISGLIAVLVGLRVQRAPRSLHVVFRVIEHLRVWSMLEVYLLGVFVAYTKLLDLAHVDILAAGYALGAVMMFLAATDASFDQEVAWQAMEARGLVHDPAGVAATLQSLGRDTAVPDGLIGCHHCGFVVHGPDGSLCPRCGGSVHVRKPNAIQRCWALLAAAVILYIPANLFPVLTAIKLGSGEPSTILGGVRQLAKSGMYPLAILVFFASITVPAAKLIGLVTVLVSTRAGAKGWLRDRTLMFRIVESIGRWSMIDVFMLSVLVGLVRLGFVASVTPGYGAVAFAGVVVLTMFASMAFDPRLMWDAALAKRR